ncbi:hypothetical protein [Nocardioides solisilvae]|uniref:hypothetical protein n=1 Tax=Nocardioides solisilvae TaxID=1542435 RepID=UPI000D74EF92|nr:hypothetical protein [Nocardioides solisilvae]
MNLARLVRWPAVALVAVVPALAAGGALDPAGATAATTCLGKPVTIVATAQVTTGSEGDDVVAMTPGGWNSFDALGGDDTICLVPGAPSGGRDPRGPWGVVNAGPGNDVVVNESSVGSGMTVYLGGGDDRFTGAGFAETVFADTERPHDFTALPGSQRDVIDMGGGSADPTLPDEVWSLPSADGSNADVISFGPGAAELHYRGAMASGGRLDFSDAAPTAVSLSVVLPPTPPGKDLELLIDAPSARATVDGVQVLAWDGLVGSWEVGEYLTPNPEPSVSFLGTEADESLFVRHGMLGEVRMGGGSDAVEGGYSSWSQVREIDGGPGRDSVDYYRACADLRVRLATEVACDGDAVPLTGFERARFSSSAKGGRTQIVGTDGRDNVDAFADRVTFHGRGGVDQAVLGGKVVRADGGPGADHLTAFGRDVVVRGQGGGDLISLTYNDLRYKRVPARRQVALGGPGRDVLAGSSTKVGDRLIGGRGRDRANGRGGPDHCDTEVTRHCGRAHR